jgi:hypothetical protein
MSESAEIINKAISEHHKLKENPPLASESITDVEALFLLSQAYAGWAQSSVRELPAKQKQLLQTFTAVERGLKRHWSFEEKELPPLFGEILMKAFIFEHNEIAERLKIAKSALSGSKFEGLSQMEILARKAVLEATVNHVIQAIEEHNRHEETIFKMIKKVVNTNP